MKVLLFGNHKLGGLVLADLVARGHCVSLITKDQANECAKAARRLGVKSTAMSERYEPPGHAVPAELGLIVCAFSHQIVPGWALDRARLGGIGYHPSLLPAFKGRGAVRAALEAGAPVTGGTVYQLTESIDGGPAIRSKGRVLQERVGVRFGETPAQIWTRALEPMGGKMLSQAVQEMETRLA